MSDDPRKTLSGDYLQHIMETATQHLAETIVAKMTPEEVKMMMCGYKVDLLAVLERKP